MKIINTSKTKPVKDDSQINETFLSLGQAIEALHEGYKEMSLKFEVATNFLSISKEQFEQTVEELKCKNFDEAFNSGLPENSSYLNIGDEVQVGDIVVACLFDLNGNKVLGRILIHVGEEFYGEKVEPNFKVGDKVNIKLGSFEALKAVRM